MIRGTKTRLRALEHDDLPQFVRWINDPQTRRFMTVRYPHSLAEEQKRWERYLKRENEHIFAIEARGGTHIGNIGLHEIDSVNRRAELGIVIGDKEFRGKGYGTDAIQAMLGWAFGYLNLQRVFLRVLAYNEQAIRCYKRCGFRHEGTLRQTHYDDGQYHDEHIMAILRKEFLKGRGETG